MSQKIKQDISIGKNIRHIRKITGMTQKDVVIKLQLLGHEISRSTYSQIECGTYNIRVSELLDLSKIFGVNIAAFFDGL